MSFCVDKGKDKILFLSKTDNDPSSYELGKDVRPNQPDIDDEADGAGLVLPSGEINWNCPCLGGLAVGPCSVEFRNAFSCFHNSKEELKGSECVERFQKMHDCMSQYSELYSNFTELPTDETNEDEVAIGSSGPPNSSSHIVDTNADKSTKSGSEEART